MAIKWSVHFKDIKGEAIVEADDRWGALVAAIAKFKLPRDVPTTSYSLIASIKKVDRKKRPSWWEKK